MLTLKQTIKFNIYLILAIKCKSAAIEKSADSRLRNLVYIMEDTLTKSNKSFEVPDLTKIIDNIPLEVTQNFIDKYNHGLDNEDIYLDVTQLIRKYGFECETHHLQTIDGYLLTMHRIPGKGKPVFLMNCLGGSSDDWVTAGPESGIAYLLAREGYDVWMSNNRGNKYSRKHIFLNPDKPEYWNFSWEEIALYDVPTFIDYILDITRVDKLSFVGFSQGTTVFYVLCSMKPEYNDKIDLMISLSAVAYMSHIASPLVRFLLPLVNIWYFTQNIFYESPPFFNFTRDLETFLCGQELIADTVCINLAFLAVGFDYQEVNATNLPVFFGHYPSGAATKQSVHYAQGIMSGKFRRFDYGLFNLQHYGTFEPPNYPLEKITAPVAIFHSKGDWLAEWKDVSILVEKLSNVVAIHRVPDNFNHMDYVWAKDVKEYIYKPMSKLLKRFS